MSDQSRLPALQYEPTTRSVQDFVNYFDQGQLDLEPPFQRKSVWSERDRSKLIDSIINGFPVPSIYLAKRKDEKQLVYDVIDGKQRLESILMFMGKLYGRGRFTADVLWPGAKERQELDWKKLKRGGNVDVLLAYKLPTHIVEGDVAEIIELFVRINSTGKALTRAEQRHARYNKSPFLRAADSLADKKFKSTLLKAGVFSEGQVSRMKHVELMCELMIAAFQGEVQNKKSAIDVLMRSQESFTHRQVKKAREQTLKGLNRLLRMFPTIKQTRFSQLSDFYSLAVLIQKFEVERRILTDRKRNRLASDLLTVFGSRVDELRHRAKAFDLLKNDDSMYRDYARTVSEGTDRFSQRKAREAILRGLLEPLFERKDEKRGFSPEQRRVLWNTSAEQKCEVCKKRLTWNDFTIDHIRPYSKGGRSELENAGILCREHNSSKGNRSRRSRSRVNHRRRRRA